MEAPLHLKYRPQSLDDVVGQDAIVGALGRVLAKKARPHAYLFVGPSGCGKTTLARIVATQVGCSEQGLVEIDAASNSGIEAMRQVLSTVRYQALGRKPQKVVIVDECHALSKPTWQSLLLAIEEPPEHVTWCLCTTEVDKVPTTIKTRCHAFSLRSVDVGTLFDYLQIIAKEEAMKVPDEIIQVCAKQAFGSVRQALVNLSTVAGCTDRAEAYELLKTVAEEGDAAELAKLLISNAPWSRLRDLLDRLRDEQPESVRIVVNSYVQKVLLDAKDEKRVPPLLRILDAFSQPFNPVNKMGDVLVAVGSVKYAAE